MYLWWSNGNSVVSLAKVDCSIQSHGKKKKNYKNKFLVELVDTVDLKSTSFLKEYWFESSRMYVRIAQLVRAKT